MAWRITSYNPNTHEITMDNGVDVVQTTIPADSVHSVEAKQAHVAKIQEHHEKSKVVIVPQRRFKKLAIILAAIIAAAGLVYLGHVIH